MTMTEFVTCALVVAQIWCAGIYAALWVFLTGPFP